MKLIKLTDVYCGDALYINSNCILSCEQKYHHESETWYTQVGLLYQNAFEFWYVKETIEDIQSQLEGKSAEVYMINRKLGNVSKRFDSQKEWTRNNFQILFMQLFRR